MNDRLLRVAFIASLVALVAAGVGAGRALTAATTVPVTRAGTGTAAISTFTNSAFDYTLNDTTPQNIDTVTFTQAPATADTVKVEYNGTAHACTNASGSVTCTTTSPQAVITATPTLRVVGAS